MIHPFIAIVGPTASGKSALAVQLAKKYEGAVVSADSMQVYTGMDVGTGKITEEEKEGIPHYMIDVASPLAPYNVAMYRDEAREAINHILSHHQTPILCGGTGLYSNAVLYPMGLTRKESNPVSREKWEDALLALGPEGLHKLLAEKDAAAAARIHPNNTRRVIRALEMQEDGGSLVEEAYMQREFVYKPTVILGLNWDRTQLRQRICARVDRMLEFGLLEETEALIAMGVDPRGTAMQGLGYRQLISVLSGETSLEEATEEIKLRTCQYAKRQMSWFRRETRTVWLDCDGKSMEALIREAEVVIDG